MLVALVALVACGGEPARDTTPVAAATVVAGTLVRVEGVGATCKLVIDAQTLTADAALCPGGDRDATPLIGAEVVAMVGENQRVIGVVSK